MGWASDVRQSIRALRREPALAFAALATVFLGVGASPAIFTVVDGVVLRPLGYDDAEQLVLVGSHFEDRPGAPSATSVGDYRVLRERARTMTDFVHVRQLGDVLLGYGAPTSVNVGVASLGFFEMFGARASVGRLPGAGDARAGATRVAVLDPRRDARGGGLR